MGWFFADWFVYPFSDEPEGEHEAQASAAGVSAAYVREAPRPVCVEDDLEGGGSE